MLHAAAGRFRGQRQRGRRGAAPRGRPGAWGLRASGDRPERSRGIPQLPPPFPGQRSSAEEGTGSRSSQCAPGTGHLRCGAGMSGTKRQFTDRTRGSQLLPSAPRTADAQQVLLDSPSVASGPNVPRKKLEDCSACRRKAPRGCAPRCRHRRTLQQALGESQHATPAAETIPYKERPIGLSASHS